ncbi:MAG: hypothetical protein H7X92_04170 [Chitinophagales bacterium]|nr:hypothetical protein [Hyphomicrobiales bacterium]
MRLMKNSLSFLLAIIAVSSSSGSAFATSCCSIKPIKDGFLAMRRAPDIRFPKVIDVPDNDVVCFGSREPDEPNTGDWVYGWYTDENNMIHYGWVNGKFLKSDECG